MWIHILASLAPLATAFIYLIALLKLTIFLLCYISILKIVRQRYAIERHAVSRYTTSNPPVLWLKFTFSSDVFFASVLEPKRGERGIKY